VEALPELLKMWGLGVPLNAPKGYANPRLMQGKRDEAMKPTNINLWS